MIVNKFKREKTVKYVVPGKEFDTQGCYYETKYDVRSP